MLITLVVSEQQQKKAQERRRRPTTPKQPHPNPHRISPDLIDGDTEVRGEVNFEKSIENMVSQVRSNPALSKSKCVVDRQLWMSNSRSLSPWSYRINHDENRKPVDIPEAKCSCTGCINPFTMQEDRSMTSVLIYTKIPVRRRHCPQRREKPRKARCRSRYRTAVESIAVGCTCIMG
uniref:Interleukin-17B n=2 Tax=Denticeps clupeoides TaxID=299321 RepID=A0A8C4A070_9TELE